MKIATPIAIWIMCPNPSRVMPVTYALSNGFGFGGTNAALVFKRFEE